MSRSANSLISDEDLIAILGDQEVLFDFVAETLLPRSKEYRQHGLGELRERLSARGAQDLKTVLKQYVRGQRSKPIPHESNPSHQRAVEATKKRENAKRKVA